MKNKKILLIFTIIFIGILIILLDFEKPAIQGKIISIKNSEEFSIIKLDNTNTSLIFYNRSNLNRLQNEQVQIYGNSQNFLGDKIIFIDKIICLSCK